MRGWRGLFARGRVAALKRRKPPGRPGVVGTRAAAAAEAIPAEDRRHDGGWTLPRLRAEIRRRGGPAISGAWLSRQLRPPKGFVRRRPRHSLKGRQDAAAVERARRRAAGPTI